ncbi:MAG: lipopolysaccharide transport periplasmic protein LptA [Pseudomonadota bacterium]
MSTSFIRATALALLCLSSAASAQEKGPFGGFKHDSSAPIEITADSLEVRQADQVAIFEGNVIAGQGTLRLTASRVEVYYDQEAEGGETGAIQRLDASGNVFLSNGSETARGAEGTYDVAEGKVSMAGDVVLTQGENAVSGKQLEIDLNTGVGRIVGRVGASFLPSSGN